VGDAQSSVITLAAKSVDGGRQIMTVDAGTLSCSGPRVNVYTMTPGCAAIFELLIAAHNHHVDEVAGWKIKGMIARPQNGNNARMVGDLHIRNWGDITAASWLVEVSADTGSQSLEVAVSGEVEKTIGWIARLTTAELAF
jgi:hypothetical protein